MSDATPLVAQASAPASAIPPQRQPLGLPAGSIRALLALCIAGSVYYMLARPELLGRFGYELPAELLIAFMLVVGYYFSQRSGKQDDAKQTGKAPLGLPVGTIRAALVVGFVVSVGFVAYHSASANDFFENPAFPVMVTVGAFLVGRLAKFIIKSIVRGGKTRIGVIWGDVMGLVGIGAGVGRILVYCVPTLTAQLPPEAVKQFHELFPSLIVFYYGNR